MTGSREALERAASTLRSAAMPHRQRTLLLVALVIAISVGLSLGTSVPRASSVPFLAALAALALGPVAYLGHTSSRRATR